MSNFKLPIKDHAGEFLDQKELIVLEDTLWWTVGRKAVLRNFLNKAKGYLSINSIMEIGCGSGGNLSLLKEYGEVSGVERSVFLANCAKSRKIAKEIFTGDFFDLEIPYSYQLTCLFDVLEHVEDEDFFLKQLNKKISSDHFLLISVPACQFLYSQHDEILHHYRRYSKKTLTELLAKNGFSVFKESYFLFFLFPLLALIRFKDKVLFKSGKKKQPSVNIGKVPKWINSLLILILRAEACITQVFPFPVGFWYIVLARKN